MSQKTDNFKAGLFVIVGLVVLLVAVFLMTDIEGLFTKTQTVQVRFSLKDGLKGLKEGASVTIGDFPAGAVTEIVDEPSEDGRVVAKIVTFEVPDKYKLFDNAVIELDVPPLGSGTELNIRSVGYDASGEQEQAIVVQGVRVVRLDKQGNLIKVPVDLADRFSAEQIMARGRRAVVDRAGRIRLGDDWAYAFDPTEALRGGVAPSQMIVDLVREIGIDEAQRQQIRNIITNVELLSEAVAGEREPDSLTGRAQDIATALGDLRSSTRNLKMLFAAISGKMSEEEMTERARAILASVNKLHGAIASAKALFDNSNALVENNSVPLSRAIASAETALKETQDMIAEFKAESFGKVKKAVSDAGDSMESLKLLVTAQKPVLERMIANMRLTSDQLKLAAIEIRRSPWRLLYKPTDKELETDNLYDASRSFALAASSLNSTAESLQAMLDRQGDQVDPSDEHLQKILKRLQISFESYSKAEQKFWDELNALEASSK